MIPAKKSRVADASIGRIIARSVRRRFHAVYLTGTENLARLDPARPVVGCSNHTNGWDGFVLYAFAHRRLRERAFHLAMEEKNLARYFFFPWLGVFGVGLEGAADAVAGLRYAVRLLRGHPDRMAWIFVQGRLTSPRESIVPKPGAAFIARQAGAQILPVVLRYEWLLESKATVFLSIAEPLAAGTEPEAIAARMNALNAELGARVDATAHDGFEALFPPRLSLNKRWDYVRAIATGRRAEFERDNR
jgi:1-acyl-sn-glycerol-3-phosphate acyltransferase